MSHRRSRLSVWVFSLAVAWLGSGCSKEPTMQGGTPLRPYPLDRCLVSDDKLGADPGMETYTFVHEGQEIKLCCKNCLTDFNKNPQLYLAKLPPAPPELPARP
jgi:hypothetical protein